MRLTLLALLIGGTHLIAAPKNVQVIYDDAAVLHLCSKDVVGCSTKVQLGKTKYLFELTNPSAQTDAFESLEGSYLFHNATKTQPGKVTGYLVKEKGHFPNPTADFEVFYAIGFDFISPK